MAWFGFVDPSTGHISCAWIDSLSGVLIREWTTVDETSIIYSILFLFQYPTKWTHTVYTSNHIEEFFRPYLNISFSFSTTRAPYLDNVFFSSLVHVICILVQWVVWVVSRVYFPHTSVSNILFHIMTWRSCRLSLAQMSAKISQHFFQNLSMKSFCISSLVVCLLSQFGGMNSLHFASIAHKGMRNEDLDNEIRK